MNSVEKIHQMIKDTDIKGAHIILGQFSPAHMKIQGPKVNYYSFLNNYNLEGCKVVSTKLFCLKKGHRFEKLI